MTTQTMGTHSPVVGAASKGPACTDALPGHRDAEVALDEGEAVGFPPAPGAAGPIR